MLEPKDEAQKKDYDKDQLQAHNEATKVKNITSIVVGRHKIDAWYFSPFPKEN